MIKKIFGSSRNLCILIFLLFTCIFFEWGFWNTYFVQDEWNGFGVVLFHAHQPLLEWFNISTSLHFFPFNILAWLGMFRLFKYNAEYYVAVAIILHTFAAYFVYILANRLSKNYFVGVLTALLFLTNSRARTAFLHLGVYLNTIPFFIFVILFFIYLTKIIKKPAFNIKDAIVLFLIFLCASLFREEGVILIPLLSIFLLIYDRKSFNKKNIKFFLMFYSFSLGFLIYRVFLQLLNPGADSISSRSFFSTYLYNISTFPYKLFVQNIIDGYYDIQLFLINYAYRLYPVDLSFEIVNSVFLDFAFLVVFVFLLIVFLIFTWRTKSKLFWKNILFSVVLVITSAGVLAAIGRPMVRIEERYLYLSGFAVLFILSLLLVQIYFSKSSFFAVNILKKSVVALVVLYLLVTSYTRIQADLKVSQAQGQVRKKIISDIVKLHPTIPKDTIFYVTCKTKCVQNEKFGLSNNLVLPFSSGPGWIIMLQYAKDNERSYEPFFRRYSGEGIVWHWQTGEFKQVPVKEFLWDMGSQGYRRIGNYSFGYFTDINLLKETLHKKNLNKNIVIGLEYDEKVSIIRDVSDRIQKQL